MKESIRIAIFFSIILCSVPVSGQSLKEYREQSIQRMGLYREYSQTRIQAYKARKNAELESYIRQAWEKLPGHKPIPRQDLNEPDVPPVLIPDDESVPEPEDNPIVFEGVYDVPQEHPEPPRPIFLWEERPDPEARTVSFSSYGTRCTVRFDKTHIPKMPNSGEDAVGNMWAVLCSGQHDNLFYDCLSIKQERNLCDWAYVKMVEALSKEIYGPDYSWESIVLQACILLQSGFKLTLGRDGDDDLHLLLASDCDMLNRSYWEIGNTHYFLLDNSQEQTLCLMAQLPGDFRPMNLSILSENNFAQKSSPVRRLQSQQFPDVTVEVTANRNLIDFYNEYPETFINHDTKTRWRFYAQAQLSGVAQNSLYPAFKEFIAGKSELEAANIILNFVQTAFVYEYDDVVWGRDRAFFADETLYYPYCDCEDRAILLSRMIRDLLGLDVVLLYYPGHLASAVHFNGDVKGDYLMFKGRKYVVCDPTYIPAPVGMTMPNMDNGTAVIIPL